VGDNVSVFFNTGDDGLNGFNGDPYDRFYIEIYSYDLITQSHSANYLLKPMLTQRTVNPVSPYSTCQVGYCEFGDIKEGFMSQSYSPTQKGALIAELHAYSSQTGYDEIYATAILRVDENPLEASNWGGWINQFGGTALGFILTMILSAILMALPFIFKRSFNMYIELMMLGIGLAGGVITGMIGLVWAIVLMAIGIMATIAIGFEGSESFGRGGGGSGGGQLG
jgi:hypothetical protein